MKCSIFFCFFICVCSRIFGESISDLMSTLRNDSDRWVCVDLKECTDPVLSSFSINTAKIRKDQIYLFKTISKNIDLKYLMVVIHDTRNFQGDISSVWLVDFFQSWFKNSSLVSSLLESQSDESIYDWICMKPGLGIHGLSRIQKRDNLLVSYSIFQGNSVFSEFSVQDRIDFLKGLNVDQKL